MNNLKSSISLRVCMEPRYPIRRNRGGSRTERSLGLGRKCARAVAGLATLVWLFGCGPTSGSLPATTPSTADESHGDADDPEGGQGPGDTAEESNSDADNDGIVDRLDRCPNEPEDRDDWEDTDGCPDPDNDGDSVADEDDACPMIPGSSDLQVVDHIGCPPPLHEPARRIRILNTIPFDSGATDFLPGDGAVLSDVVEVLQHNPDVQMVIEGHTDDRESPPNQNGREWLSQERANSVLEFLVGQGIDRSRLRAVGYSDTRPLDTSGTAEGRERNRRVSFHVEGQDR